MRSSAFVLLLVVTLSIDLGTCCWPRKNRDEKTLDWVKSVERTGSCGREIDVTLTVDCKKAWTYQPTDAELTRLCNLIKSGINEYWSRTVQREGNPWDVTVNVVEASSGDRKTIVVKTFESEPTISSLSRSHNSGILSMTMKYLQFIGGADANFRETAAHEIGHSFLHRAKGMTYSWTHKGSSTFFQNKYEGTENYPTTGEIDLMKYYNGVPSNFYSRVKAAEEDVLLLLGLAHSKTKQTC